jgi:rare lipoprotein A
MSAKPNFSMIKSILIAAALSSLGCSNHDCDSWDFSYTVPCGRSEIGKASWYSTRCNGGTQTASGKKLVNSKITIAHKHLPLGSFAKVTNLDDGRSIVAEVIDRGPYIKGRVVDLTPAAAKVLNPSYKREGVWKVKIQPVTKRQKTPNKINKWLRQQSKNVAGAKESLISKTKNTAKTIVSSIKPGARKKSGTDAPSAETKTH